jgi:ABC-type branched-subunit amino acid transport system ATPase component
MARAAAIMAVSNMGQLEQINLGATINNSLHWTGDAYSEVCQIAGHLMESYEHEEIFAAEAEAWLKTIKQHKSLQSFAAEYPHHEKWLLSIAAA